jgi:feruloyl esterase
MSASDLSGGADLGIATNPSPLEPTVTFVTLGTSQPTIPMPTNAPYTACWSTSGLKYVVTRDETFNSLALDPENPGVWGSRISELSTQLDTSTDISAFAARGGKLLLRVVAKRSRWSHPIGPLCVSR